MPPGLFFFREFVYMGVKDLGRKHYANHLDPDRLSCSLAGRYSVTINNWLPR